MRTGLEAVLQAMVNTGWANESGGSVDAPTGHYARVTVEERELDEVVNAFNTEMRIYGLEDENELIGHWLVVEDSQGFIHITTYDNPIHLTRDYLALDDAFALWDEQTNE